MKNLEGRELKKSIKENILKSLKNAKNPDIEIKFIFTDKEWKYYEEINYFAGIYKYNGAKFNVGIINREKIIDIITDNIRVDKFKFIATIIEHGKDQCHGHGEYWGTDKFTHIYTRI